MAQDKKRKSDEVRNMVQGVYDELLRAVNNNSWHKVGNAWQNHVANIVWSVPTFESMFFRLNKNYQNRNYLLLRVILNLMSFVTIYRSAIQYRNC